MPYSLHEVYSFSAQVATSFVFAIVAAGLAAITQALPWPHWSRKAPEVAWAWTGRFFVAKWLNCLLCQSFWHVLAIYLAAHVLGLAVLTRVTLFMLLGSLPVCMFVLGHLVPRLTGRDAAMAALFAPAPDEKEMRE